MDGPTDPTDPTDPTERIAPSSSSPYRPFVGGAFRWRLGLRPLDPADWLEPGPDRAVQMAAKARVLAEHHHTAFDVLDDIGPESAEVLDAVVDHLRRFGPDRDVTPRTDLHPLEAAARLVQEDLVLLVERDRGLVVGGGCVCFPNRWDLASKVGRTLSQVHAPVAQLNEQLEDPIDRFLDRLRPERPYWRLGWGVLDTDELYQAVDGSAPPRPGPEVDPSAAFLRVERETLRRFPVTGAVLFTIRTHVTPIPSVAADPDDAARLADALDALPVDVAEYKQLDVLGGRIAAYLRAAI